MTSADSTAWVKATASDQGDSCVEQRRHAGAVEVRDTKDAGTGPVLRLTPTAYAAWLAAARTGELDHLLG